MDQVNRRSALTMGAAAIAGLVAIPLTSSPASAEEHRWHKIHEACEALHAARKKSNTPAMIGADKREKPLRPSTGPCIISSGCETGMNSR